MKKNWRVLKYIFELQVPMSGTGKEIPQKARVFYGKGKQFT